MPLKSARTTLLARESFSVKILTSSSFFSLFELFVSIKKLNLLSFLNYRRGPKERLSNKKILSFLRRIYKNQNGFNLGGLRTNEEF